MEVGDDEKTIRIGFAFAMPYGGTLEVRASEPINQYKVDFHEEIEGVTYRVFWNDKSLPWTSSTQFGAFCVAAGCQYGATEMAKKAS